ncbi:MULTISPECIES: phosphocholine-specific phospholipase C [unclassified Novosphingobium]|uniref:phosphocholine-specific phospholipase C n=1 Tax=unclassified Novosphingobium TaxID=2644732 RepID=UPI0013568460|nr:MULTISPECIES: phospholipase C, phosphocholine-specific [unclassified Novosphingobium]
MEGNSRRQFLRMAGGAGAASALSMTGLIDRALAIAASGRTSTIMDVEHVVVCMQENRSFDHYFGMLNGVRGLGDPRPLRLPGGRTVWSQPSKQHPDGYVMPFHGDSKTSRSFLVDGADQSHVENMHIFDRGRYDRWGHTGELHNRMLHYGAGDLPFYYALADAFTVCDAYHCSTMTQTYPNRMHLFTGCNGGGGVGGDPEMQNYGEDETPSADMATDRPLRPDAYRWTTYAERLEAAGVSWKVYQEYDNFGDNLLSVFPAFRPCDKASQLYRRGRSWVSENAQGADRTRSDGEQLVTAFRRDVETGSLPQVSWIVTAADLSEHPAAEPSKGEHVVAGLIEALIDNPQMFAKTVFILNYDEAGGFYDHMPPPVAPVGDYRGHSTVPLDGEAKDYGGGKPGQIAGRHPVGLGIRTPAIVVSPWSKGGNVCSELFDHTSVLRFMERRFGVAEPNISAWRRAVCGDLGSVFDFAGAASGPPGRPLPSTADFRARVARSAAGTANAIPARQQPTAQMPGQRGHRPLPYRFTVDGRVSDEGRFQIVMANHGSAGAAFTVHDNSDRQEPWHYTIGAGDQFTSEQWHEGQPLDGYDLTLRGPNGFWRRYAGELGGAATSVELLCADLPGMDGVELRMLNRGERSVTVTAVMDAAYPISGQRSRRVTIAPGQQVKDLWTLQASDNWYDLSVSIDGDIRFLRRFAGKVENGRQGRTDPGIGEMRLLG